MKQYKIIRRTAQQVYSRVQMLSFYPLQKRNPFFKNPGGGGDLYFYTYTLVLLSPNETLVKFPIIQRNSAP